MKKGILLNFIIFSILYSQIQWGPDIKLSPPQDSMNEYHPRAAVWGDTIHLVYYALHSPSLYDIFYMRSTDKGNTWEPPKNLTINDPDDARMPWITVWGNKVHVVYQDGIGMGDSIMYIRSFDGGVTWNQPVKLFDVGMSPKIISRSDTLIAVIVGNPGPTTGISFRKSVDGGNTWEPRVPLDSLGSQRMRIIFEKQFIHLNSEFLSSTTEIQYFRSPDKGNTWEGPFVISPVDNWASVLPVLAVSDSNVYISWMEGMYCSFGQWYNVNIRKSNDNGNSFLPRQSLTSVCAGYYSDIYAKDSIVVLVWMDERDNPGQSDFELYWRASYDYGNTWIPEERLTYAPGDSRWPSLAGWGNEIYLFWVDTRTDSVEIFFKKGVYIGVEEPYSWEKQEMEILSSNILFLPDKVRFYMKEGRQYFLSLFDLQGRKIKTIKEGIGKGKDEILLKNINPGSYFLVLETQKKTLKKKILILNGGN